MDFIKRILLILIATVISISAAENKTSIQLPSPETKGKISVEESLAKEEV